MQLHCNYDNKFTTYKLDTKFSPLSQHKKKLKYQTKTETVIDILPKQQDSQPYQLPGIDVNYGVITLFSSW